MYDLQIAEMFSTNLGFNQMFVSSLHLQQCWQSLQSEGLGMLRGSEEYSFDSRRPTIALSEGTV